jgi:cell division protein FtsW
MMMSVSPVVSLSMYNDPFAYLRKYLLFLFLGLGSFILGVRIPVERYRPYALHGLLLSMVLLILVHVPIIGRTAGGAARWINIGPIPFQPSEFVKIVIILYVAHAVALKQDLTSFLKNVLPIVLVVGVITGFVLIQPDLGTSVVLLLTTVSMLVIGGASPWELLILGLLGFRALAFMVMRTPYQMQRLMTFVDPWKDPLGTGFNTIQSLLAVGSGGFWGVGLGHSKQKFTYLPQQATDYVFAILCEEGGFILGCITIATFAVLIIRGFRAALYSGDTYRMLVASGLTFCLGLQALINMMVATGLSPAKGLTLPFISYGGSSLVMSLFMAGMIAQISKTNKERR